MAALLQKSAVNYVKNIKQQLASKKKKKTMKTTAYVKEQGETKLVYTQEKSNKP